MQGKTHAYKCIISFELDIDRVNQNKHVKYMIMS